MPDRDDITDPMDEAYLRAEQAQDDEAARAARRARVLAAVAQESATPPALAPSPRPPIRRYGGWLAAACVAGLSVWTAAQVYRLTPRRQEAEPAPANVGPLPAAKAPAPPSQRTPPLQPAAPQASSALPPAIPRRRARPIVEPTAPTPPPAEVAPPPPLPIPPVEKPIAPPPPPAAVAAAPAPPTAALAAKPGASELNSVVVSGSRVQRRDFAVQAPVVPEGLASSPAVISSPLAKVLDGPSRLREAAAAGRTADIEALLDQGVPVDAADADGETALMKSIETGQRAAAALLRRHGASLDLKNRAGTSARDMAAAKGDAALAQALDLSR